MNTDELILLCAVRYALGRRSYMVSTVAEHVALNLGKLSKYCVDFIIRDIEEEIEFYHRSGHTCGDACDERVWLNLLEKLKSEPEVTNV